MLKPPNTMEEAKRLMLGGLGKAELEFVTSITVPIFWIIPQNDGQLRVKNGSAFFVDAGEGPFGVTAAHVIEEWHKDCTIGQTRDCLLGCNGIPLPIASDRIIASHSEIDLATFKVSAAEIAQLGKTVLTGYQRQWPPKPPQTDRGIYYCGYPGLGRRCLSAREISFGASPGGGVATSVSEIDVCTQMERQHLFAVLGHGLPPENFDFGGISGGPMLTVVETALVRSWALAGVIYQGPNPDIASEYAIPGLEVIRARRVDFILPNGSLNVSRWHEYENVNRR